MLNQVILVGVLVDISTINKTDDGRTITTIDLEVKRNYENAETGNYDSDIIECTLNEGVAEYVVQNCVSGSTIGIKGKINTSNGDMKIDTDKVTFIKTESEDKNYEKGK
ncbi:single-stranded DNA-binding protein [Mycoplasmatota bacterium WC44]